MCGRFTSLLLLSGWRWGRWCLGGWRQGLRRGEGRGGIIKYHDRYGNDFLWQFNDTFFFFSFFLLLLRVLELVTYILVGLVLVLALY